MITAQATPTHMPAFAPVDSELEEEAVCVPADGSLEVVEALDGPIAADADVAAATCSGADAGVNAARSVDAQTTVRGD